jgi:hypothetical protein
LERGHTDDAPERERGPGDIARRACRHFTNAGEVFFGAVPITTYTVNSGGSITALSPPGTGTVDVTVATPSGTSSLSSADVFTYNGKK